MHKIKMPLDLYDELPQILDTISDSVVVYDTTPRVLMMNKAACESLQITQDQWIGKTPKQYVGEGYLDRSLIAETISAGKEVSGIVRTRHGVEILSRVRPIYQADGKLKLIVSTSTQIKEMNDLRIKLEKERLRSDRYRQEIENFRKYVLVNDDHIFQSSGMQNLLEAVRKVAPLDCTVLITGESGVGKEILATTIHMNSRREHMPFIPVSIPAIPENLLEAELFGYDEGAFTGARHGGKIGLFEMAQEGTLFLDEVGDIPYSIQVKILRAIENHEITRLGGTKSIKLNVRILAATNKNLAHEVKMGLFRKDLYYRLNVVPIVVRPLRERNESIVPLSLKFLDFNNIKYKTDKEFSAEALEELCKYHWPGNIRELKNVIERLAIFTDSNVITDENIHSVLYANDEDIKITANPVNKGSIWNEYKSREQAKILDALNQTNGNKAKAARIMGMSRASFYKKLNK